MKIIAVDPSLRLTGICLEHEDGTFKLFQKSTSPRETTTERIVRVYRAVWTIAQHAQRRWPGEVVGVVEGLALGISNSRSISAMAEVHAMVKLAFWESMIPFAIAPQAWWKAVTMGKELRGKKKTTEAQRKEYLMAVKRRHGVLLDNPDIADAYLMSKALRAVVTGLTANVGGTTNVIADLERQGVVCERMQPELVEVS